MQSAAKGVLKARFAADHVSSSHQLVCCSWPTQHGINELPQQLRASAVVDATIALLQSKLAHKEHRPLCWRRPWPNAGKLPAERAAAAAVLQGGHQYRPR